MLLYYCNIASLCHVILRYGSIYKFNHRPVLQNEHFFVQEFEVCCDIGHVSVSHVVMCRVEEARVI